MMEMYFKETAEKFLSQGKPLLPFHPFPTASLRAPYEQLDPWLKAELIAQGELYLGYEYPRIRATDFMAFWRTGNRTDYEDIYFARRYALNSLAVAECVEYQGRFLDDIINGIFVLCEESAWQLPPHSSYGRGGTQDILPDYTRPILDLFACETGALLACVCYLLSGRLDAVSPYITRRIGYELNRRILTPYLEEHFWWMGRGEEPMCNWTPWCTQNVLLSVFLCAASAPELPGYSPETGRAVLLKAAESLDFFLKDYGEDGCCDEGAQYYRHAGLCLDGAAGVLNQITGGAFEGLMRREKIRKIASYIFNVHVDEKYYFNFADCSPVAGRAGVREYLFGKHTDQPELMQFAAEDFRASRDTLFADESHRLNLFYRLQAVFCYEEIMACKADTPPLYRDLYYESVGLFLARNDTFCLAVKAGDNDDSHNHNDVGSLTLYRHGQPILVDIGVESYTGKTFSSRRYEIWTMQSCYHNLPSIDGTDQQAGAEYLATDVSVRLGPDALGGGAGTHDGGAGISGGGMGAHDSGAGIPDGGTGAHGTATDCTSGGTGAHGTATDCTGGGTGAHGTAADSMGGGTSGPGGGADTPPCTVSISMELSGAYPLPAPKPSYVRKVVFDKRENRITLTDRTDSRDVILHFILCERPEIEGNLIRTNGASLTFRGASLASLDVLPITDKRLRTAWEHDLYRVRLKMEGGEFEMDIT